MNWEFPLPVWKNILQKIPQITVFAINTNRKRFFFPPSEIVW